jgi:hypothetical protein
MKDERIFKSFTALNFDGNTVTGANAPAPSATLARSAADDEPRDGATKSNDFRDMLYQRYTAPYALAAPYRHWGINE